MKFLPTPDSCGPTRHYNIVVDAWGYLLGEDLHYGYFTSDDEVHSEATDKLTHEMLGLAQLTPSLSVLDVGCGTGKAACRMALQVGCSVLGISPSTACISKATKLAIASGVSDLAVFRIGDGTRLDMEDSSFDCVWVMESSHLMYDKAALVSECARVLRPGGRLILCDVMLRNKLSLQQVIDHRDEFLLLAEVFGRAIMQTSSYYREQMTLQHLQIEACRDISAQVYPTFEKWRENALLNRSKVEELIGGDAWRQFYESCGVLTQFWERQVLGYYIIAALKPSQGG
jgi:27-O-demethylrifamycin SV methyltransferase